MLNQLLKNKKSRCRIYFLPIWLKIQGIFSDKKKKNGFNFAKLPEICIKSGDITFNDFNFKILDFNLLNTVSNNSKKETYS